MLQGYVGIPLENMYVQQIYDIIIDFVSHIYIPIYIYMWQGPFGIM